MERLKQRIEGTLYRQMELRAEHIIDDDERTIRVVASTEFAVLRKSFFSAPWIETLGHKKGEVDLSRLKKGAPVLYNHSRTRDDRIGVVESATLADKRVEAVIRLSKRDSVDDIWQDVRDGILKNISMGYQVNERTLTREGNDGPDEFRITSWTPAEISLVDVGADPNAQIGRDLGDDMQYRVYDLDNGSTRNMSGNNGTGAEQAAREKWINQGREAEQKRVSNINALFVPFAGQYDEVRNAAIADGTDVEATRKLLLDALGKGAVPVGGDAVRYELPDNAQFSMPDRRDEFTSAVSDMLLMRANIRIAKPHPAAQDFAGRSLVEIARLCLSRSGINTDRMGKPGVFERAFTTSDFPLILQDSASKSVLDGYNLAPSTFAVVTRETFAPDFKTQFKVAASAAPDLKLVNEDGEYTYSGVSEVGSSVALSTYGRLMAVSRQTLINDDLNEILRALQSAGTAIARLQSDIVWGLITSNVVMSDGFNLFDSVNHANVGTAGAISVTTLGEMKRLMRLQQAPKLNASDVIFLDLQPFVLVVPPSLETVAEQLLNSIDDPANANNTFNPFAHKLRLIVEPRLETDSTTRYYLMVDPQVFTWFDRVLLEGEPTGFLGQQEGWSVDGMEFKVRNDFASVVNDHRGAVKNDGV